jgi:hypothetical protein
MEIRSSVFRCACRAAGGAGGGVAVYRAEEEVFPKWEAQESNRKEKLPDIMAHDCWVLIKG